MIIMKLIHSMGYIVSFLLAITLSSLFILFEKGFYLVDKLNNQISVIVPKQIAMKITNLTEKEFLSLVGDFDSEKKWKYLGNKPAVVDFYVPWSRPCRTIASVLDEIALIYNNDIYIYKVDVEKEVRLSKAFGIHSMPTLLLIPMEGTPKILQGVVPKKDLIKAIDKVLLENVGI